MAGNRNRRCNSLPSVPTVGGFEVPFTCKYTLLPLAASWICRSKARRPTRPRPSTKLEPIGLLRLAICMNDLVKSPKSVAKGTVLTSELGGTFGAEAGATGGGGELEERGGKTCLIHPCPTQAPVSTAPTTRIATSANPVRRVDNLL